MLNRFGEWVTALDLTGIVALPLWVLAGLAACAVLVCALTLARADGRGMLAVVVLLIIVLVGWWARDHFAQRDVAAELRALDTRAFELATRAFAPGSALGCLDANAGETVEAACERALFASPEATAAATSYVAAQLSLLASASELGRRHGGANPGAAMLRRALEADRFGIVAHVLAVRDGCTPGRCGAFTWLRDPTRINANLAERPFDARVKTYSASWPTAGVRGMVSAPTPPPAAAARVPNNLYFPSASSIPPVNIMTAEPPAAQRQSQDTTGTTESAPPTPPRRPPQADSQTRQPPSTAPARSGPMPLAPPQ
ncbi:MAG: hypothetical protein ACJ8FA_13075 [Xanthobacteraceae bacterium]